MNESNSLKTDLYELTMAGGYFQNNLNLRATFELYCHTMPPNRSYLVVCGLEQICDYILNLRFTLEDVKFLQSLPTFKTMSLDFFAYLQNFRFSGNVWAMQEGDICFANEPILRVESSIIEAQILETYLLSVINVETSVASKAAWIVRAACCDGRQRAVVDFGSRRAHGPEAGVLAARAAYIGGCVGTSNVEAGRRYNIPTFGTMAHSWIQAFETEEMAYVKYHKVYPGNTILLIDTYDTIEGVKKACSLGKTIKGVRIDSGDILQLSQGVRKILDKHSFQNVKIIASGNLDEYKIENLVTSGALVDIFGVGTEMSVSRDFPALDLTYKLVETCDAKGRVRYTVKRSQGKATTPGCKQVLRFFDEKQFIKKDVIVLSTHHYPADAKPLLQPVIENGKLFSPLPETQKIRENAQVGLDQLNSKFHKLNQHVRYKVEYSQKLKDLRTKINRRSPNSGI